MQAPILPCFHAIKWSHVSRCAYARALQLRADRKIHVARTEQGQRHSHATTPLLATPSQNRRNPKTPARGGPQTSTRLTALALSQCAKRLTSLLT